LLYAQFGSIGDYTYTYLWRSQFTPRPFNAFNFAARDMQEIKSNQKKVRYL